MKSVEKWCGHPEWPVGVTWDPQKQQLVPAIKPPASKMLGLCEHNMACPVCGFGWGQMPDPCSPSARTVNEEAKRG